MLVDTHCHINSNFYRDSGPVIRRAREAGISFLLNAGVDIPTSMEASALSEEHPFMLFSPGIHPHAAGEASAGDKAELRRLACAGKAAAAGETGLDFHYREIPRAMQTELFRETIAIARTAGLPVIIHNREASVEVLKILSSEYTGKEEKPNGVLHCFSGDGEFALECIKLNFFISFAGNLTYPNAGNLRLAAKSIPGERLLLETDCPFLAPQRMRGEKNEPSFLVHTAAELAKIKELALDEIIRATGSNAAKLLPAIPGIQAAAACKP